MALFRVEDVLLPKWGSTLAGPHATHRWVHRAIERGGLALLALYNLAYIAPLVALLAAVSDRRVLGRMGRWNRGSSPWVKAAIAIAVVAMSLALLVTL